MRRNHLGEREREREMSSSENEASSSLSKLANSYAKWGRSGPSLAPSLGISPTSKGMIGTQAIVAYPKPDGTVAIFTSPVDSFGTRLREENLTFPFSDLLAMFLDNEMVIFATIELPENTTSVNHVWQDGPVSGDNLGMHDVSGNHLQSMGNLNLSSAQAFGSHGGNSKTKLKIAHGVRNAVSWGIMMPLGFMVASFFSAPSLALPVASGSSCSDSVFPNNQVFASCTDLPNLDSFLHWTYTPSSSTLHIAYRHSQVSSSTWVAWGINPTSKCMIGTQTIVAYQKPERTMVVFTSPVDSYGTRIRETDIEIR
ncbi:hypothetical protein RHMOL_Rhmol02G0112100 [Rhododendron molle]|uniref:Uncharacterized protein n=1 Tax=Rhododendron molle TaxID=49168 RepID=A0ACC0PQB8_RHOML|nr:hypothetical protein RHMOL_Rhmol02G0112100 [Rhododendron molle]